MRRSNLFVAAVCCLAAAVGCGYRRPFERAPGTVEDQRRAAYEHDPYTDNDLGPEVVGGRPREFSKPDPLPERSRTHPASQIPSPRAWFSSWFSG